MGDKVIVIGKKGDKVIVIGKMGDKVIVIGKKGDMVRLSGKTVVLSGGMLGCWCFWPQVHRFSGGVQVCGLF